jgi:hypothetical protein
VSASPTCGQIVYLRWGLQLRDKLLEHIQSRETPGKESDIDVLEWVSRTALELIGQGGLGYSFRALDHKEDAYGDAAKQLL